MIKAVANKALDLTEDEFSYYKLLVNKYGDSYFRDLFQTNKNGIITSVTPPLDGQTPMAIVFFLLNIMFSQRMRVVDAKISKLEALEKKVDQA